MIFDANMNIRQRQVNNLGVIKNPNVRFVNGFFWDLPSTFASHFSIHDIPFTFIIICSEQERVK